MNKSKDVVFFLTFLSLITTKKMQIQSLASASQRIMLTYVV